MGTNMPNTSKVYEMFTNKDIMFTEGCNEDGANVGTWHTAEIYGRNIIEDLNNYIENWLYWNIVLDETREPNHVDNLCNTLCDSLYEE